MTKEYTKANGNGPSVSPWSPADVILRLRALVRAIQEDEAVKEITSASWIWLWVSFLPMTYIMLVLPICLLLFHSGVVEVPVLLSFAITLPIAAAINMHIFGTISDFSFRAVISRSRANYEMYLALIKEEDAEPGCHQT